MSSLIDSAWLKQFEKAKQEMAAMPDWKREMIRADVAAMKFRLTTEKEG